jgi:hypothetical protein
VRKHLWDEFDNGGGGGNGGDGGNGTTRPRVPHGADSASLLRPGESPPYDSEAT